MDCLKLLACMRERVLLILCVYVWGRGGEGRGRRRGVARVQACSANHSAACLKLVEEVQKIVLQ